MNNHSIQNIITYDNRISRIEIKALLKHVLKFNDVQLITNSNYILTNNQYSEFNDLVKDLLKNIPISYIIGYKEFYSRNFIVNENTLIPRPETELLIDHITNIIKNTKRKINNPRILDLGTGSGCIAITLKLEHPTLVVDALDVNINTLNVAKQNAKTLNADINFIHSDWFKNVPICNKYDIIVSNPPYIALNDNHLQKLNKEPQEALTDFSDGLTHYKTIILNSKPFLNKDGYLFFEHGYQQAINIRDFFKNANYKNIKTLQDYSNLDRITLAQLT